MTTLSTARFLLRPLQPGDAERLAALANDPLIARNTARVPHPYTIEDARSFLAAAIPAFAAGTEYPFAICEDGVMIACAGLLPLGGGAAETGYWVGADFRRRGVAVEASEAVIRFGFDALGLNVIEAGYFTDNPASGRVLARLGFRETGDITKTYSVGRGGEADTVRMILTRADWLARERRA